MAEETTTVTAEVPAELYDRFVDAAAADGVDEGRLLASLVGDRVELAASIATYADRGAESSALAERGPGVVAEVPPPVAVLVGFDLVDVGEGTAEVAFRAGPEHANPMGTLHGGILCDVADAAMGTAFATTLGDRETFTTLELDAKYLKPVWDAELTASAEVTDRGRTTGLVECTVTDDGGDLVAKLDSVCTVLRGEAAEVR
jgi:uncharacterized protein (TIGR00369 family)